MTSPKYIAAIDAPLIPFYAMRHNLMGMPRRKIDPESILPPLGAAVVFVTSDGTRRVGETVLIEAGVTEERTAGAFFELAMRARRVSVHHRALHSYEQVVSWQLTHDMRDPRYGTHLFNKEHEDNSMVLLRNDQREVLYEIGLDKPNIPMSLPDGRYHHEAIIPPRGMVINFWLSKDPHSRNVGEVVHISRAGPMNRRDTAILVHSASSAGGEGRNFIFLEDVAQWQQTKRVPF